MHTSSGLIVHLYNSTSHLPYKKVKYKASLHHLVDPVFISFLKTKNPINRGHEKSPNNFLPYASKIQERIVLHTDSCLRSDDVSHTSVSFIIQKEKGPMLKPRWVYVDVPKLDFYHIVKIADFWLFYPAEAVALARF